MRLTKEEKFEYKDFPHLLFEVRFELARSRLMDTNIDKLQEHLIHEFAAVDHDQTGLITIL